MSFFLKIKLNHKTATLSLLLFSLAFCFLLNLVVNEHKRAHFSIIASFFCVCFHGMRAVLVLPAVTSRVFPLFYIVC